jgi:predicted dinucleotide-binding enzyme
MKIGILGAGRMTTALAGKWIQAGHEVLISGRTLEKAKELAAQLGEQATSGTFDEAVAFSDTLLIAVRHEGVITTLEQAGAGEGAFNGKTIIDCSNPVEIENFTLVGNEQNSMAERIQETAKGSTVVKAFNLCEAQVWEMNPPVFDGRQLVVPYCCDSEDSSSICSQLISGIGCQPMKLGPLIYARHLEAMAAIVISRLFGGADAHSVFNWITPDPSSIDG